MTWDRNPNQREEMSGWRVADQEEVEQRVATTWKANVTEETRLSHSLMVQLPMIQRLTMKTIRTVPGQIVIRVLRTKRVLKLMRFKAPMLRDEASVKSLLCSSITRQIR